MPPLSTSPAIGNRKKSAAFFSLGCGCKDSRSVSAASPASLSGSSDRTATPRNPSKPHDTSSLDPAATSISSYEEDVHDLNDEIQSFSGLLRQLSQLEQSVMAWDSLRHQEDSPFHGRAGVRRGDREGQWHRNGRSERGGEGTNKMGESVAVVKETADPLGEFRRSMLQMIVEKEIVDGEELRELLGRFLTLNSPRYHPLIVRAFTDIWDDVFAAYETAPNFVEL